MVPHIFDVPGNGYVESNFFELHVVTPDTPFTLENEPDPDGRAFARYVKDNITSTPALGT